MYPDTEDDPEVAAKSKLVCYGTSAGLVKLIDLNRNKVMWKQDFSGTCIYGLSWNKSGILAVGPTLPEVHVLKFHKTKMAFSELYKVTTDQYPRTLAFSPIKEE